MILAGEHAGKQAVARFLAEAEAIAALQHTNIVQIYEIGEWRPAGSDTALPFFSLEYVEGGSLARQILDRPIDAQLAAHLVQQLAAGMAYAHDRGIIHRDLKPENILLQQLAVTPARSSSRAGPRSVTSFIAGRRGETPLDTESLVPKITDFGLAKQLSADGDESTAGLTNSGAIMGTPSYMSPDQAAGHTRMLGPSTDIYALGGILYRLLTGRPPFQGSTPWETIKQVITREPVAPRELNPSIPLDLETICLKCLQKEPSRRYPSATVLEEELRRFREGRPILARPAGGIERVWRWCQRNPVVAGLITLAALFLLVGSIVSGYFAFEARRERDTAVQREREAKENERQANEARQDADYQRGLAEEQRGIAQTQRQLAVDQKTIAEQRAEERRVALAQQAETISAMTVTLAEVDRKRGAPTVALDRLRSVPIENRAWEWNDLRRKIEVGYMMLAFHSSQVHGVAYHPQGALFASAGFDGRVCLWDARTGIMLHSFVEPGDKVNAVAFSPDGSLIASGSEDGRLYVWNVQKRNLIRTLGEAEWHRIEAQQAWRFQV